MADFNAFVRNEPLNSGLRIWPQEPSDIVLWYDGKAYFDILRCLGVTYSVTDRRETDRHFRSKRRA